MKNFRKQIQCKTPKIMNVLLWLFGLLMFTSCAHRHINYNSGVTAPNVEVATLITKPSGLFKDASVYIVAIDADYRPVKVSSWDATAKLNILPGIHTVRVRYTRSDKYIIGNLILNRETVGVHSLVLKFEAKVGRTYALRAEAKARDSFWKAWIVDTKSKQIVGSTTTVPPSNSR